MNDIPAVVGVLKVVMLAVMLAGGIAVFRELIPMARGRIRPATPPAATTTEKEA